MGIIVQIPADITKECTVTKCAAKEFINHVKFNRTINHKLGISAQDMMRGVGFKFTDLAKGAVYYRNGESGPWDPTKVDARKELKEKQDAAVKIQAIQRGKADREKVKKMKEENGGN